MSFFHFLGNIQLFFQFTDPVVQFVNFKIEFFQIELLSVSYRFETSSFLLSFEDNFIDLLLFYLESQQLFLVRLNRFLIIVILGVQYFLLISENF